MWKRFKGWAYSLLPAKPKERTMVIVMVASHDGRRRGVMTMTQADANRLITNCAQSARITVQDWAMT